MWIFQNDSFLSVVAHRELEGQLLVRSRIAGDIERAIPGAVVFEDLAADYRYRAVVSKEALAAALAEAVHAIDYPNFKGSIPAEDSSRRTAYHRVWDQMYDVYG